MSGHANPKSRVTLSADWLQESISTQANIDGYFSLRIASVDTFGSVALQFDYLSVGYTGRDGDTHLFTIYGQYLLMRLSSITKGKMKFGIKVLSAESRRALSSSSPMSEHGFEEI